MASDTRVGPVLESGEVARAVIDAVRQQHRELEVQDRGAYVRLLVPLRCAVKREAIERALGRAFRLPGDLELVMPSFKGRFRVDEHEAVWEAGKP